MQIQLKIILKKENNRNKKIKRNKNIHKIVILRF